MVAFRFTPLGGGAARSLTVGVTRYMPKAVLVANVDGIAYAIDDTCPHMGASLATGYVEDGGVTCPWHAWRFRLSDGAWADYTRIKIGCYPVRVEGDEVQVQVEADPAPAN